jgi:RNA polymerase sigma-70 factor (ECF subfamily)
LLTRELNALYGMALRLCRGRAADAEDLLQESVLRSLRHFDQLRERGAGRAWLFRILIRTHANRMRAVERLRETFEGDLDEGAFEQALASWRTFEARDVAIDYLLRDRVIAAVDELPLQMREVLWLVDVEGFGLREVAQMLDVPGGTVASRLYRARQALRSAIAPWIDSPAGTSQKEQS